MIVGVFVCSHLLGWRSVGRTLSDIPKRSRLGQYVCLCVYSPAIVVVVANDDDDDDEPATLP